MANDVNFMLQLFPFGFTNEPKDRDEIVFARMLLVSFPAVTNERLQLPQLFPKEKSSNNT